MNCRRLAISLPLLAACSAFTACETVDETGRSRVLLFGETQMNQMAVTAYAEETSKYKVITGTTDAKMVQDVGQRIAKACGRNYEWEFKLLDAPDVVNAFALPGGKIAVYSGLLKVTQDEHGLATVMGHEVAHATSKHGAERMTDATIAQFGLSASALVLEGWETSNETKGLVVGALGLVGEGALKKFSRTHESEADRIGLEFMMRAGFDPEAAPKLWERMAKLGGGEQGFLDSFFATHPPSMERAAELRRLIPILKKKLADEQTGKK